MIPSVPTAERIAAGLARLAIALRQRAWQEGHPRDLTPTQGEALLALSRKPGATLGEVAAALAIRPSTASAAIDTLAEKGYVEKLRRLDDRRTLGLQLTATGRAEAERVAQWPDFLARVVDELAAEEQAMLLRLLQRMVRQLQVRGEVPVSRLCATCTFFRPFVHAEAAAPHHCGFVDRPFGDGELRFDCPDQVPAAPGQADLIFDRFARGA